MNASFSAASVPRPVPPTWSHPWHALRHFTAPRSAMLPTPPSAAEPALDTAALVLALGQALPGHPTALLLHSAAPGQGHRLHPHAQQQLAALYQPVCPYDLALVLVDGASAPALALHAAPCIQALRQCLDAEDWSLAPTTIVTQSEWTVGDAIAPLLGAKAVLVLVGERPGLGAPDSLGLVLTWAPQPGLDDAERHGIANVGPAGLPYAQAASQLHQQLWTWRRQMQGLERAG